MSWRAGVHEQHDARTHFDFGNEGIIDAAKTTKTSATGEAFIARIAKKIAEEAHLGCRAHQNISE
jgi:hypothetical protein